MANHQRLPRIAIMSPVRQSPRVLSAFLNGLDGLDTTGFELVYYFVDDNDDPTAEALLHEFCQRCAATRLDAPAVSDEPYPWRREETHEWPEELMWRVAHHKDRLLAYALAQDVDAVFLVDADLVLHPMTLQFLLAARKDVVAEIYWTRWDRSGPELPQVWLRDAYAMHEQQRDEALPQAEVMQRIRAFLSMLRKPGVYRVGGLGACTLIRRRAMEAGVRFAEIYNLGLRGEDRHFCIRAAALGFELHVDTHVPALHLYRDSDLDRVPDFERACEERAPRSLLPLSAFTG